RVQELLADANRRFDATPAGKALAAARAAAAETAGALPDAADTDLAVDALLDAMRPRAIGYAPFGEPTTSALARLRAGDAARVGPRVLARLRADWKAKRANGQYYLM